MSFLNRRTDPLSKHTYFLPEEYCITWLHKEVEDVSSYYSPEQSKKNVTTKVPDVKLVGNATTES